MQSSHSSILVWRAIQAIVWLAGATILFCLFYFPSLGILMFWNILIPIAPALFVVAPGLWRNVCPLATTVLLPRHAGLSKRRKLSPAQTGGLNLIAVIVLYIIAPLRHAVFNHNGTATALLIVSMALIGVVAGFRYEWKSAWCSGLCPIHPVEKLYGGNISFSLPNAHCKFCMNCVVPCPDSTPNIHPSASTKTSLYRIAGILTTGGLPGFIWGWFHVPDHVKMSTFSSLISVYAMPLAGLVTTLAIYIFLSEILHRQSVRKLVQIFAAAGVSCYYWYRIPALIGFGENSKDGLLVDLKNSLPGLSISVMTLTTTIFFFYWMVIRKQSRKSWVFRPEFAKRLKAV